MSHCIACELAQKDGQLPPRCNDTGLELRSTQYTQQQATTIRNDSHRKLPKRCTMYFKKGGTIWSLCWVDGQTRDHLVLGPKKRSSAIIVINEGLLNSINSNYLLWLWSFCHYNCQSSSQWRHHHSVWTHPFSRFWHRRHGIVDIYVPR